MLHYILPCDQCASASLLASFSSQAFKCSEQVRKSLSQVFIYLQVAEVFREGNEDKG
jgi:hypothetical protein